MILTIFYDSHCPLCNTEIKQLKVHDNNKQLCFEDIHAEDFIQKYPYINKIRASELLHGQLTTGDMIYGLDVTCLAWRTVGKHRWLSILRWPIIRWFADMGYRFFARYRHNISALLMPTKKSTQCKNCKLP